MPPGIPLSAGATNNAFVSGHKGADCGRDWEIGLLNLRKDTDSGRIAQGDFPCLQTARCAMGKMGCGGFGPVYSVSGR